MAGRFLVAPLVVAVALWRGGPRASWALAAASLALAAAGPSTSARTLVDPDHLRVARDVSTVGVTDERAFYAPVTGLFGAEGLGGWRSFHTWLTGEGHRRARRRVVIAEQIGFLGLAAGPGVHIVDRMGLSDALMARLPASPRWRPGHPLRRVPAGYVAHVLDPRVPLDDPSLARYLADLDLLTRAPLWSAARWRAIARVNLGRNDALLAHQGYRDITRVALPQRWTGRDPDDDDFLERGLRVRLAPARALRATARVGEGRYTLTALHHGAVVARAEGTGALHVTLPAHGADELRLTAREPPWRYALHALTLASDPRGP